MPIFEPEFCSSSGYQPARLDTGTESAYHQALATSYASGSVYLNRVRFSILSVFFILSFSAFGQIPGSNSVGYRFRAEKPNPAVEKILYLAVGVELAEYGLTSREQQGRSEYTLTIEYAVSGGTAELRLSMEKGSKPGTPLSSIETTVPLDHGMNKIIKEKVRELVVEANLDREPERRGSVAGILPDLVEANSFDEEGFSFFAGISGGGVVHIGEVTDYFLYGASGGFAVDCIWYAAPWRLSAGGKISISRAFNNSVVSGGTLYIGTTGAHLSLGNSDLTTNPWNILIGGGAAELIVLSEGDTLVKSVPYAEAGLKGTALRFYDYFMNFRITYRVIFDPDILVGGIAPTVELMRRF